MSTTNTEYEIQALRGELDRVTKELGEKTSKRTQVEDEEHRTDTEIRNLQQQAQFQQLAYDREMQEQRAIITEIERLNNEQIRIGQEITRKQTELTQELKREREEDAAKQEAAKVLANTHTL